MEAKVDRVIFARDQWEMLREYSEEDRWLFWGAYIEYVLYGEEVEVEGEIENFVRSMKRRFRFEVKERARNKRCDRKRGRVKCSLSKTK